MTDAQEKEKLIELIDGTISDLVSNFLYYDRKEDEELPRGAIESLVTDGSITVEWLIGKFSDHLREALG